MKYRTVQRLRLVSQVAFLALFATLAALGRVQLWLPVFLLGLVASLVLGRLYCGWACPMGTLFRPANRLTSWLRLPRLRPPRFLQARGVRWVFVAALIGAMVISRQMGVELNLLLWVTAAAVVVTLFVHESFWHTRICPYGTLLSVTTRAARRTMRIDEERCKPCGKCRRVCPTHTIATLDTKKRRVLPAECLLCFNCAEVCPQDVIRYRT